MKISCGHLFMRPVRVKAVEVTGDEPVTWGGGGTSDETGQGIILVKVRVSVEGGKACSTNGIKVDIRFLLQCGVWWYINRSEVDGRKVRVR